MSAVRLRELSKTFHSGFWRTRAHRALDAVSLDVPHGAVLGYLGPNGAGKTTTLRLLMQLVHPTSGSAEILGRPAGDVAVRRRIGFLPEAARFYDACTAEELLVVRGGAVRLPARRAPPAGGARAGPGRYRGRAPAAATGVFPWHAAAGRDRAGPAQRPGGRVSGRADDGARPAWAPRRAEHDPGPAGGGANGVRQLAHPERRGSGVQSRRHPEPGTTGRGRPYRGSGPGRPWLGAGRGRGG